MTTEQYIDENRTETRELTTDLKLASKIFEKYGKVEVFQMIENDFEILITEGFSKNAMNTLHCIREFQEFAADYPILKKCHTDDNKFHVILTKTSKQ